MILSLHHITRREHNKSINCDSFVRNSYSLRAARESAVCDPPSQERSRREVLLREEGRSLDDLPIPRWHH